MPSPFFCFAPPPLLAGSGPELAVRFWGAGGDHLRPVHSHCQTLRCLRDALGPGVSVIGHGEKPCLGILGKKRVLMGDGSVRGVQDHQSLPQDSPALLSSPGLGHLCCPGQSPAGQVLAEATPPSRPRRLEPCYLSFRQEGGSGRR